MAETDFDIEKAGAEFDKGKGSGEEPPTEPPMGGPPEDPPGFKSYDEYIADGGDPDMYRGRKAYEAEHQRITENKELRRELKGLKGTVQQTMEAVQEWQSIERAKIRAEIEAELHEAMENEDPKAAVEAQKRLDAMDDEVRQPVQEEHPVIQGFREDNPVLDAESDEFDPEFNADVEALYNGMYQTLSIGGKRSLTEGQIKRCLKKAMKEARELHGIEDQPPQPGESPRNRRASGGQRGRRSRQEPAKPKAEHFKIDNPRNPRQTNAAVEVRDMIREKYGEEAAAKFEENLVRQS